MKLDTKTKKVIFGAAVAMYVAMFVCSILCAIWCYDTRRTMCVAQDTAFAQTQKTHKVVKNIEDCLRILAPVHDGTGRCEWLALRDGTQTGVMENYDVAETKVVSPTMLSKILDKKYYGEQSDVVNSGIYMPTVRLTFESSNGRKVTIVYSFANARFDLYRDNEMVKRGMLFECDELESMLEAL